MTCDPNAFSPIDLPLARVVLYSSGVGYFEHQGEVDNDQRMVLQFTPDQIRDVLKSMVLSDEDGGRIDSVSYPAQEPISRALQSFDIDLSGQPALHTMLRDLRGCEMTVHAGEAITGRLLNVDETERVFGEPRFKQADHVLSMTTDTGIRTALLSGVSRVELADRQLQDELNRALALIANSRNRQRRPVEIRFRGEGKRRVRVGYLVDTAVWKTSYRLDLSDGTPILQGWAIVDNTSDHDWRGVKLSLVSGQPISFVQDLYTPLHVQRPEVKPKLAPGVMPQLYEEGIAVAGGAGGDHDGPAEAMAFSMKAKKKRGGAVMAKSADYLELSEESPAALSVDMMRGVDSVADGATIGELFSYTIAAPVDLDRRSSGMLPIYTGPVEAEKVSIYNETAHHTRPLNGAALRNSTGLKLLGGPITVFDAGYYAGDAQVEHLPPDDSRLLSYAVDLEMTVDPSEHNDRLATAVKIAKGVLTVNTEFTKTRTYTVKNKADQDRLLILEYACDPYHQLVEPSTYEEKTPGQYRFRMSVGAGSQEKLSIRTLRHKSHGVNMTKAPASDLHYYAVNDTTDPKLAEAIAGAVALRQTLDEIEAKLLPKHESIKAIEEDQARINKNLKGVGPETTLGKRYLSKLNEQEDEIERLRGEIDGLNTEAQLARESLADYLAGLSIG